MKPRLDMDRIATQLGAERRGKVAAKSGYFGAAQLAADIQARFKTPPGGGRVTDPTLSEKRLVGFNPKTLEELQAIAEKIEQLDGTRVGPMQVAALMIEKLAHQLASKPPQELLGEIDFKKA